MGATGGALRTAPIAVPSVEMLARSAPCLCSTAHVFCSGPLSLLLLRYTVQGGAELRTGG
jgi:hypothetical protein